MDRRYYSRRHFERLSNGGPDTPEQVAERIRRAEAGKQAHAEALAKFGGITPANAREFLEWQERRIRELTEGA